MDLFNMENIIRIHEFYKKKILMFQATVLKFGEVDNKCKISAQYLQNCAS